jgi:hypothetical protein
MVMGVTHAEVRGSSFAQAARFSTPQVTARCWNLLLRFNWKRLSTLTFMGLHPCRGQRILLCSKQNTVLHLTAGGRSFLSMLAAGGRSFFSFQPDVRPHCRSWGFTHAEVRGFSICSSYALLYTTGDGQMLEPLSSFQLETFVHLDGHGASPMQRFRGFSLFKAEHCSSF